MHTQVSAATKQEQTAQPKAVRAAMNRICRTVFICEAIFLLTTICYVFYLMLRYWNLSEDAMLTKLTQLINASAIPYLISLPFMLLLLIRFRKQEFFRCDLIAHDRPMTAKIFLQLLLCFLAGQTLFSLCYTGGEWICNQFGYTLESSVEQVTNSSTTPSMFLYVAFLAPIFEELLFRGAVLRAAEPFGKNFAIVCSAVLFGIYHGNLLQGIFAALVGLLLGYAALQYSLKWSILLHVVNNFVISEVLGRLIELFPPATAEGIWIALKICWLLAGIVVLWRHRKAIRVYLQHNATAKGVYTAAFTTFWFLAFLAANVLLAISMVEKITG